MPPSTHTLQISWSVWDKNPTIFWTCNGILASATMKLPPVAASHLQGRELIAVIGNFDEFGSANCLLYSYHGTLRQTITAPTLGQNAQFVGVSENNEEIQATVGFQTGTVWKEEAGRINLDTGAVTDLHRNY